jgi:hypothetical protein
METNITIPLSEYHAIKDAEAVAEVQANELAQRHELFISKYNGANYLSIVDNNEVVICILQIPALKFIQLKKAGVREITKQTVFE